MTDVLKLSDGTTDCDLMFSSAPGFQLLAGGLKFATPEHENLYHSSEWQDGEELARHKLENRVWPMKLALKSSSSDDNIANELIKLNRLVGQARRYWLENDCDKVFLQIQLDGATNYTRYDCLDVQAQSTDIFSYFNRKSGDVKFDGGIGLEIVTQPWGYGTSVTLANSLGTPHFEEDGDSDGLADQWSEVGAANITTLDTAIYIGGTQSQKIVTTGSGSSGIESDTIDCSSNQGDSYAVYAWVYKSAGDDIQLQVQGSSSGHTIIDTYSAATKTDTGAGGNTWKLLEGTGTVGASDTTLQVELLRASGSTATTFYVDKAYLQLDTSTVPDGWSSCRKAYQHSDGDEGKICYVDVDDTLGDLDAPMKFEINSSSTLPSLIRMHRRSDKMEYAADKGYFGGTFVEDEQADGSRIDNTYNTITPTSSWGNVGYIDVEGLLENSRQFVGLISAYDANMMATTSGHRADFRIHYQDGVTAGPDRYSDETKVAQHSSAEYVWLDLGTVDFRRDWLDADDVDSTGFAARAYVQSKRDTGSHAVRVDCVNLFPIEEDQVFMVDAEGLVNPTLNALEGEDAAYSVTASPQLLDNPTFDSNVNNWTDDGNDASLSHDTTNQRTGAGCAKITLTHGPATGGEVESDAFSISAGDTIMASIWTHRVVVETPFELNWEIRFYTSGDALISSVDTNVSAPADKYVYRSVTTIAPATTAKAKFVIDFSGSNNVGTDYLYLDDASAMVGTKIYRLTDSLGHIPTLRPDAFQRLYIQATPQTGSSENNSSTTADYVTTKIFYLPHTEFLLGTE